MEQSDISRLVDVYAEATPNPAVLKFVTNKALAADQVFEFTNAGQAAEGSPLAAKLFEIDNITAVFIMNNFVSITKSEEAEWVSLIPEIRTLIKTYLQEGGEVVKKGYKQVAADESSENGKSQGSEGESVLKIKQILNDHVAPAVEMDGGAIEFKSFEKGTVTLVLKGACSGCPSSIVTLKNGIEGLLKRTVDGVEEVVAESE
jgi:NFU1 iron-sulfur cluster scaffold homolog, mitochondrial